jgi:hypothetical protein
MTISYVDSLRQSRIGLTKTAIETGAGTAKLKIYTAPRPATGGTPTGATLLVSIDIANPCGTINGSDLLLDIPEQNSVIASGVHAWARVEARDGSVVCDMPTGVTGSGADVEISASQLYSGGILINTAATIREP